LHLRPLVRSRVYTTSLYNSVAESSLRKLKLWFSVAREVEAVAERLAHALAESSLEELAEEGHLRLALSGTVPIKDLDLVFSYIDYDGRRFVRLQINRKWKFF
jgi:hypothetical protein